MSIVQFTPQHYVGSSHITIRLLLNKLISLSCMGLSYKREIQNLIKYLVDFAQFVKSNCPCIVFMIASVFHKHDNM